MGLLKKHFWTPKIFLDAQENGDDDLVRFLKFRAEIVDVFAKFRLFGVEVGSVGWGETLLSHAFLTPEGVGGFNQQ